MNHTIGRFAPTPSGRMHPGNLFSALLAWLSVRAAEGEILLRMEDLDPDRFFRISRGCIVSRCSVKSVLRYINGRLKLSLEPESSQDLLVARARVDDFLKWLG